MNRTRLAWYGTKALPCRPVSVRAIMTAVLAVVFNFTTNCQVYVKYFN